MIAAGAGLEGKTRYHLRFEIPEKSGSLLQLLIEIFGDENIVEFQYGKSNAHSAYPVIGIDATPAQLDSVIQRSNHANIKVEDITDAEDALFRVIPYDTRLFENELFLRYEFPERGGALHEFLSKIRGGANLCYFNYQYSGERVGRALIGLEFKTSAERDALLVLLDSDPTLQQRHQILSESAARRILGSA